MSKVEDLSKLYVLPFLDFQYEKYGEYKQMELSRFDGYDMMSAYEDGYHQAEKELIDKAIGWIEEINNHHHIMRYSDCCEPTISELTEWFKNYMKGE
jgi:hypothetical protein